MQRAAWAARAKHRELRLQPRGEPFLSASILDLRHTFASWLVQRRRTLKEVQEALGQPTITMTMRYSHLAPDHLRAAVAVLDGVLPAAQPQPTEISAQESAQEQSRAAIQGFSRP